MTDILAGMRDLVEARQERFDPIPMRNFFSLKTLKTMTWVGTFSWTNQENEKRWLVEAVVKDPLGIPQTPPELARDYLKTKYSQKRRHTENQFKAINMHRSPPLYAAIGTYQDMVQVDLKSAYWSILQIVGWDVDYHPSRWLGKRSDMDDFPFPDDKLARNSLVSSGLITKSTIWTGEKIRQINAHKNLINYDIWALCQDVLHALATIALKAGAVHIHTDGYIIPRKTVMDFTHEVAKWGLRAELKAEGDCKVKGVGAYTIGDKRTKKVYHFTPHDIRKVYEPDISFLRPRMAKLARARVDWTIHPQSITPEI